MKYRLSLALMAVLAASVLWAGCAQDIPSGVTTIIGSVVDQSGAPIFGVPVGVYFSVRRVSGAPGGILNAAAVNLAPPYPNPAIDPEGVDVTIPVSADTDTTGRVEIWGAVGGVASRIATIFNEPIPAGGKNVLWNGRDNVGQSLPNGLYFVRLILPAGGTSAVAEYPVLLNRTEGLVSGRDIYNALSDADGNYFLDDLPVGERITETSAGGAVLGQAAVENRVVVFFHDSDYLGGPEAVIIGPGETVEVVTVLRAVSPGVAPADGPGPLPTASR
jgi:hypothetical protein